MSKKYRNATISSFIILVGVLIFFSFFNPVFVNRATTKSNTGSDIAASGDPGSGRLMYAAEGYYLAKMTGYAESEYETKLSLDREITASKKEEPSLGFRDALREAENTLGTSYPQGSSFILLMTFEQSIVKKFLRKRENKITMLLWNSDQNDPNPLISFELAETKTTTYQSAQVPLEDDRFRQYGVPNAATSADITFSVASDDSLSGVLTFYESNGDKVGISRRVFITDANAQPTISPIYRALFLGTFSRRTPTAPTTPTRPTLPTWPTRITKPT